jgi:hypothetical protein
MGKEAPACPGFGVVVTPDTAFGRHSLQPTTDLKKLLTAAYLPRLVTPQLIETALPKPPRIPGVTSHWLAINGVQPDVPENVSVGPLSQKRRQLLGPPGPGSSRMSNLQEAAAAAAAAAVAGEGPPNGSMLAAGSILAAGYGCSCPKVLLQCAFHIDVMKAACMRCWQ